MRHIFIINPHAGKRNATSDIMAMAKALEERHGVECECILTASPGHATETCRKLAETGEELRFYACGGDGTINEVANGIIGFDNAAMTCIPVGTGNDFLKNFGPEMMEKFRDAEHLWDGPVFSLDAIDCNGRVALTIACAGFDARVAQDVHTYGNSKMLPGQSSYVASLIVNFLVRGLTQNWKVSLDGVEQEGEYILSAACNGRYYGGGFLPVPEARMDDGVMNTIIVKKVSRLQFLRFVGPYSKGAYKTLPTELVQYATAKEVRFAADSDITACLDGEIVSGKEIVLRLSDKKIRFFGPEGCDPNATALSGV